VERSPQTGLLDRVFAASELTGPDEWCKSHGATPGAEELGAGMLYYALTYSLPAEVCVCLGSGGGFVPRMMRQAQRDLALEGSRTILVDGADAVPREKRELWGSPSWVAENSWFRRQFPDIELVLSLTKTAHEEFFVASGIEIDYLHIDADHHYEAVRLDFDLFAPLVRDQGVITLHDSGNYREPCGVPQLVEHLRRDGAYSIIHFPIAYGTALVQKNPA
jgi:hypothetical protein